jgi:hypothetical protein
MSTLIQRTFTGGELAPALYARVDTVKYVTGAKTIKNFIVMKHGGVINRPGTSFICELKDSSKTVRLLPFVFNTDQTYVLEVGDGYIRIIRSASQVTSTSQSITGITNANPGVLTYGGADSFTAGDHVYLDGIVGAIGTHLNGRTVRVGTVVSGSNTFELLNIDGTNLNTTSLGAYTSGGTVGEVYTVGAPYDEADLPDLQFVQSGDVMTIVHPNYQPRELTRTGHATWSLDDITFGPDIAAPTNTANSGAAGSATEWVVTAVASETFEESLKSTATGSSATPSSGSPITITWTAVTGATEYNVYKKTNGVYGLIGVAGTNSFIDNGLVADPDDTPPTDRNPFTELGYNASTDGSGYNPSTVTYIQQRRAFANTDANPEGVWTSRTGQYYNMSTSKPIQDDDSVTFSIAGRQVNEIRHLLDLGKLVALTSGAEWTIEGNESGILTPSDINLKQHSQNGSSSLAPLNVGGNALYVQARGSIVRDLGFDYQADGYRGNDLTVFATHLFEGYTITDWAYQQNPNSVVWAVRSDGTLLGLTYVREHQVFAWHKHETDGLVENVCVVPEGTEDAVYLVVKRTINGATKRYIERMNTRFISAIEDAVFVDSALTYDGRNTVTANTMTLSGGTTWAYDETLTCTYKESGVATAYFETTDVGNAIHLTGSDGSLIRFTIDAVDAGLTFVTGRAHKTVPAALRTTATADWSLAVDQVTGLWHLEGQTVSVFADGFVVANPNNDQYTTRTVSGGMLTLDKPYAVIHVGIPYISDIETLDIDTDQGETLSDKKMNVQKVTLHVESSRGLWAGGEPPTDDDDDPLEGLTEYKLRNDEDYDSPPELKTGKIDVNIQAQWNSNGRVFIRQIDPLPASVLAVVPAGFFPFRG